MCCRLISCRSTVVGDDRVCYVRKRLVRSVNCSPTLAFSVTREFRRTRSPDSDEFAEQNSCSPRDVTANYSAHSQPSLSCCPGPAWETCVDVPWPGFTMTGPPHRP